MLIDKNIEVRIRRGPAEIETEPLLATAGQLVLPKDISDFITNAAGRHRLSDAENVILELQMLPLILCVADDTVVNVSWYKFPREHSSPHYSIRLLTAKGAIEKFSFEGHRLDELRDRAVGLARFFDEHARQAGPIQDPRRPVHRDLIKFMQVDREPGQVIIHFLSNRFELWRQPLDDAQIGKLEDLACLTPDRWSFDYV